MTTVEKFIQETPKINVLNGLDQMSEYLGPKESEKQLRGLYLINTRLWLDDLSKKHERAITIGSVPDGEWNKLFDKYDNFWFMGIYKPSQKGQEIARQYFDQYRYYLPDIDPSKDVVSSPFAVSDYSPNPLIARNWEEWDGMVEKLHQKGKKVFIDYIPNHTALDHEWVKTNPEYYIQGNERLYLETNNFLKIIDNQGLSRYFAYGKDPNFGPWIDTLQLNYANPFLQKRMAQELSTLAKHADGFRCDMAMLINQETFLKNWEWCLNDTEKQFIKENSFWQQTIPELKNKIFSESNRKIEFIAEAYWEEEELGKSFDFIYNHHLYNNVKRSIEAGWAGDLRSHLDYLIKNPNQEKTHWLVYTENHDEKRAVESMGENLSKPAVVLLAMVKNSIFMVNQGQENGCRYRPPMQVSRFRSEEVNLDTSRFYDDLLSIRKSELFQTGEIKIINSDNGDQNSILFEISKSDREKTTRAIVAVNISKWVSFAQFKKDEDHVNIYNLTSGQKSDSDEIDGKKIVLKLEPGEVKIACLSALLTKNNNEKDSYSMPDMEIRPCF